MSIKIVDNANCYNPWVSCTLSSLLYGQLKSKIPQHRFNVFQEEFLSNVQKYESNESDLYIHIRGEIFFLHLFMEIILNHHYVFMDL